MCFALLHLTDIVSLQIEGKTFHQQKDYDFMTILALLWWSGNEPTIYLRYACTYKFIDER